jgi:hypothetical protein
MKELKVIYSPLCEANGSFIGQLREWLVGKDVRLSVVPFDKAEEFIKRDIHENCFIDVFYNGKKIDSVPLHREKIYAALGIEEEAEFQYPDMPENPMRDTEELRHLLMCGDFEFLPITRENYLDEMSMCLNNYPFGNPPKRYHSACIELKAKVFEEVFEKENLAGVYAKYAGKAVGLVEVMPREVLKKYGYMTGTRGKDANYLCVGCYEVGYGIPRIEMLDELMFRLITLLPRFSRSYLEGIGILGWNDGFNPYWVFDKYGFQKEEELNANTAVFVKTIR